MARDKSQSTGAASAPTVHAKRPGPVDSGADTAVAESGAETEKPAVAEVEEPALAERGAETEKPALAESGAETEEPAVADSLLGTLLQDRYEIAKKIGQGGMGAVYEARHRHLGKRVAVKVLLDKFAERDQIVARLRQEAKLASSIGHPNIIDITDVGVTEDGKTYVVMEYLEGESLGAALAREGPFETPRLIRLVRQVASALGAAHSKGILHRDVKPENIFLLSRDGAEFIKVVDFGISKSLHADDEDEALRLTQTGMVLGTPLYMSPEQARGDEALDHRIDIYALGVILYELTTGEIPFRGTNYLNILSQVISDEPAPPSALRPGLDRNLESVILKALAKDPGERYQTMAELDSDLAALEGGDLHSMGIAAARWRRRRERKGRKTALFSGAGLALAATGLVYALSSGSRERPPVGAVESPASLPPVAALVFAAPADAASAADAGAPAISAITVVSIPAGATIYHGDRNLGATPLHHELEKRSREIVLRAELAGFEAAAVPINPFTDDGREIAVKLVKTPRSVGRRRPLRSEPTAPAAAPSARRPGWDETGDLMRNPHTPR